MPSLTIGRRRIPYRVRESGRARRKRIEVTPAGVEVIVPTGTSEAAVDAFVDSRRRWLHDKTEELAAEVVALKARTPEGVHSGAKVLFRGRYLRLRVEPSEVDEAQLTYRTGFWVKVPREVSGESRDALVAEAVGQWMDERLTEDAWEVIRRRGIPHGFQPRGVTIKNQATLWGSCGRDGILRLDRKLVRVPKAVMEYVVVHELCHLERRDHSPAFWALVKRVMPDYGWRKDWLKGRGVGVG